MSAIGQLYAREVKDNLEVVYATFPITEGYKLGDFGLLKDDLFTRLGNVSQFGIDFGVRQGATESTVKFVSASGVSVMFHGKVDAGPGGVPVNASVDISFSEQSAVFFNAAGCTADAIENQIQLGEQILQLNRDGKWQQQFAVITTLVKAKSSTIVMSSSSDASITIQATSSAVQSIDLDDASIQLSVTAFKDLAIEIVTEGDLTPMLGLSGIHGGIFSDDSFGPLSTLFSGVHSRVKGAPQTFGSLV